MLYSSSGESCIDYCIRTMQATALATLIDMRENDVVESLLRVATRDTESPAAVSCLVRAQLENIAAVEFTGRFRPYSIFHT